MKATFTPLLLFIILCGIANAQNTFPSSGAVGIGTTTPNSSSLLDVTSTSKGILVPRMTKAQRNAIASPAVGLLVFQTDGKAGFYFWNGTKWMVLQKSEPITAGSGINVSGSTITNTAPDQTVTVTPASGINVSGAYPNFTISNSSPDQLITLTGDGDVTVNGTYPNFTISASGNGTTYSAGTGIDIDGTTINNTAPDQEVTLTGDGATTVTGTYPNFTISSTDNNSSP